MPIYLFKNPETEEVIEVLQSMKEEHKYTDSNGLEWDRVFTSPNAAVDCSQDGSMESFMKYTKDKKGTMGEIWEASREASQIRENREGKDTVKKEHFKKYSKKRRGMKHQQDGS